MVEAVGPTAWEILNGMPIVPGAIIIEIVVLKIARFSSRRNERVITDKQFVKPCVRSLGSAGYRSATLIISDQSLTGFSHQRKSVDS